MPIQRRAGAVNEDPNGALTLTIPASVQAGDLLELTYHVALEAAPVALPEGWAYVPEEGATPGPHLIGNSRAAAIFKVAGGGDAGAALNLAVTAGAPVKQTAVLNAWSGCDQVNPIHKAKFVPNESPSGTSHVSPQVTTTLDGCEIVQSVSFKDSAVAAITAPTGYTDRGSATMDGNGRSSTAQASKPAATAGTYGGEAWTTDAIPSSAGMFALALAPQVATQTSRPVADEVVTNATDETGGTTGLYSKIDEATLDTGDYVRLVEGGVYEALLGAMTAPPSEQGFAVRYVPTLGDGATAATVDTYLRQGTTDIAHWTDTVDAATAVISHSLTAAEFAAITNWSDLRVRWVATDLSG